MEDLLNMRAPVLSGIVNGIDPNEWNPRVDTHLAAAPGYVNYDDVGVAAGKAACKAAMQAELGLPVNPNAPMVAFIGRLDGQKGADLVLAVAPWLIEQGCQVVCLGTGDPALEARLLAAVVSPCLAALDGRRRPPPPARGSGFLPRNNKSPSQPSSSPPPPRTHTRYPTNEQDGLKWLEGTYPKSARGWVGFNVAVSHRLTAAADMLLMPSRFEPCGVRSFLLLFLCFLPPFPRAPCRRNPRRPPRPRCFRRTSLTPSPPDPHLRPPPPIPIIRTHAQSTTTTNS